MEQLLEEQPLTLRLLNKLSVSELVKLTKFSKSYISQVKHHRRPPSQKLLNALTQHVVQKKHPQQDYYSRFLESRSAMGVSPKTLKFYRDRLARFVVNVDYLKATRQQIQHHLNSIPANQNGLSTRHCSYRALKTFYRWLSAEYGIPNPIVGIPAPILSKPILPSLEREQVLYLIEHAHTLRDKAIIALFTESGLRLSELASVDLKAIDWKSKTIKTMGKGRREAYAPLGSLSEQYLKAWLAEYQPNGNSIWNMNRWGIISMLNRLEIETGIVCNPHTFRRTFACLLRKAGVDSLTIQQLGRWESISMVQRYTRSVTFEDSMKHYKAPLG